MQVNKENSRNSAMPIGLTDSSRVSNNSSKVHLDVRVQTYLPTTWMVAYFALLVGLFALALFWMERLFHGSIPPNTWWYYDIPWIALTVASWFPTFQSLYFRKTFLSADMDRDAKTCQLSGQHFGGSWNIRDKDPRRAGSSQAVSITLGVFILIMFLVESGVSVSTWLMHSPGPSPAVKANVVQQLCIPWILAGIFVRFLLSWKYPNIMLLRRNGKRLWVQFKD